MNNLIIKPSQQPVKVAGRGSIGMRASGLGGTVGGKF